MDIGGSSNCCASLFAAYLVISGVHGEEGASVTAGEDDAATAVFPYRISNCDRIAAGILARGSEYLLIPDIQICSGRRYFNRCQICIGTLSKSEQESDKQYADPRHRSSPHVIDSYVHCFLLLSISPSHIGQVCV